MDLTIGNVTVLVGEQGGKYPHGNSLLVAGSEQRLIIDPSLSLVGRALLPRVDAVINSHCHEDHIAGNHLFAEVPWCLPEADVAGIRSLDGLMAIYGLSAAADAAFRRVLVDRFHFTPRADALAYVDGHVFELGGGVGVRAIHAPGHTRGHSLLYVEPDDVLYLGDIDLSSFGPYYGDAWSSLEDFERTLGMVRELEARYYATFHHIGVLEGRGAFLERLERFSGVIATREARLLEFLGEPRSLGEIVAHGFIYRPGTTLVFAADVERRSMSQHLERLIARGRVREVEAGRYLAASGGG